MKRCMHEVSTNPKRSNDQNVAICLKAWRGGAKAAAESILICGEFNWDLGAVSKGAPNQILYMPAGSHEIYCRVNGEPKQIEVHVTSQAAEALQSDLEDLLEHDVKPFVDFNHKGEAAAATPVRFIWKPDDGIYLELEWSRTGKENVEGRDFKHFSPTFEVDKDGNPTGLPPTGPIGALVNNPAFRKQREIMDQIAAELAAQPTRKEKAMSVEAKGLGALAKELFGDEAPDSDDDQMPDKLLKKIKGLKAKLQEAEAKAKKASDDKDDAEAKAKKANDDKDDAEAQLATIRKDRAEAAVDAAVQAGKLPGKDADLRKYYVDGYLINPSGTQKALDAMSARGIFKPVIKVDGADRRDIGTGRAMAEAGNGITDEDRAEMMMQRRVLAGIKERYPKADADTLLIIAKQEAPEAFVNG